MSKMADLEITIEEMLEKGDHPATISAVLNVPVTWVYAVSKYPVEELSPFITVNS
jgi:hypothetical protein